MSIDLITDAIEIILEILFIASQWEWLKNVCKFIIANDVVKFLTLRGCFTNGCKFIIATFIM